MATTVANPSLQTKLKAPKLQQKGPVITSAAGVLALLDEPDPALKVFGLKKLDSLINTFWFQISDHVGKIETLYEDPQFKPNNELAALVVSKVYYHLGAFEESLTYALGAGDLFNVNDTSEFVETIIAKCIDHYTKLRVHNEEVTDEADKKQIDPRLEAIVNRMFDRCLNDKQFKQAVGIALETRRMDILNKSIKDSDDPSSMLTYAFKVCMTFGESRSLRNKILRILTDIYMNHLKTPDYINVCQCFIFLDDAQALAEVLVKLTQTDDSVHMAYQIGFDLYESATQQLLQSVQAALRVAAPAPIEQKQGKKKPEEPEKKEEAMDTDESAVDTPANPPGRDLSSLSDEEKEQQERIEKLHTILGGETSIFLRLQFLIKNSKTDMLILKNTKDGVRNSVCHTATVIANSFMHCGTTSDQFLRDNLEWLSRATNWAKFTATASLGVIHKGHEKEALALMAQYLPKDMGPGSSYSEGGGLYALGLIHANHGGEISDYLLGQLKDASSEMVRHGGCLGLGLAAMGSAREDIYEQLKFNLFQDDAVTGEAAGLAMGLVMLGTKSATAITDMVQYAQETQHEKILRGLAVGIALTMYGRMEEADALIESLLGDKDPILRWSGMYTLAMAYCGSGNNQAIRRLLHVAVSDVNDDVRRVAVTCLGFLLYRSPEQCPDVVSLLSESYNPHVRFGAAMALGIACAGTGLKDAIALLEPMTNDPVNYVRQGALVASALVLVQHNDHTQPKVAHFRTLYAKVIADKHEDIMAKFGAILAQGIIDAGGRNCTVALVSRGGHTNMEAVVGMLVFCQHWFWYPLAHFLSLAFKPAALILLNKELKMPKLEVKSSAKPSMFAYPPNLEDKKEKVKEKVETAVLSITNKQKKKDEKKEEKKKEAEAQEEGDKAGEAMEVDPKEELIVNEVKVSDDKSGASPASSSTDAPGAPSDKEEKPKPEPGFEMLANPARVMKPQLRCISVESPRYQPVKDPGHGGIIVLRNCRPGEEEELVEHVTAGGPKAEEDEDEPEPPEPFEYTED